MKPTTGTFKAVKLPPASTVPARCYSVIDLGTLPNIFKGQPVEKTPLVRKVYLSFELPAYKAKFVESRQEEPFVVGAEFTHSFGDKATLRKFMSQWMNRDMSPVEQKTFDIGKKCPGKASLISIIHNRKAKYKGLEIEEVTNENTSLKLNGIMQLPEAMQCPAQLNPTLVWDWDTVTTSQSFNLELFNKIPGFLRTKMMTSEEYKKFGPKEASNPLTDSPEAATDTAESEPVADAPIEKGGW